jgi:hypothetical protein
MRQGALGIAMLALAGAGACKGPAVPHPLTGQSRYLCCNLHFEKDEISDANYQVGTLVPFGTRVQILEVRKRSVKFVPAGFPPLTLEYKYNAEGGLPFETYLARLFVVDDPRLRFAQQPAPAAPRKGKGHVAPAAPASRLKVIESGGVEPGMTKEEVLTSLGYPPAHRTPSLEAPQWHYWQNRWHQFVVYFDGDRVSRVQP